jgi:hypothetical protein
LTLFLGDSSVGRIAFLIETTCILLITAATGVGHWVIAARMRALRTGDGSANRPGFAE